MILAMVLISSSVFAFNTHTVGNDSTGTREPSSTPKETVKK
jgi:hypothetical protein